VTGGPTGGRGPPTVLEFLVINFSVCLCIEQLLYNNILHCMVSSSTVNGCISVNIFSIRFVVLLASDRL